MGVSGAQEWWYLDGHYTHTQYLAEESTHRMLIEAVKITTRQLQILFMAPLTALQLRQNNQRNDQTDAQHCRVCLHV